MAVVFTVNLVELKQSCHRLVVRLADEAEGETEFVVFNAIGNTLELMSKNSSEGLRTTVRHPGRVQVPCTVFCCLVEAVRYAEERRSTSNSLLETSGFLVAHAFDILES